MGEINAQLSLLLRVDASLCAFSLASVVEILRPLPLTVIADAPTFVAGLAIIRGEPLAIVSLRRLLGGPSALPTRIVVLRVGARRVGLAVDEVVGIRVLPSERLGPMPSLLSRAELAAQTIGALDGELLLVLDAGRLVPEHVFALADNQLAAS